MNPTEKQFRAAYESQRQIIRSLRARIEELEQQARTLVDQNNHAWVLIGQLEDTISTLHTEGVTA